MVTKVCTLTILAPLLVYLKGIFGYKWQNQLKIDDWRINGHLYLLYTGCFNDIRCL